MNDNAKKWVAALRSGEWKQTTKGALQDEIGFCCLGVACELYQREVGGLEITQNHLEQKYQYDHEWEVPPPQVRSWLGLGSETGRFISDEGRPADLTAINDSGIPFPQIASLIESEPPGLFV